MTDSAAPLDSGAAQAAPSGQGPAGRSAELSPAERGVLLAVLYAELFDYPLRISEVAARAPEPIAAEELEPVVAALEDRYLEHRGDWVTWAGKGGLVAIRERREATCQRLRREALRFGRRMRWIPFLRTVGVCGSLAADNAGEDGDVDLFCLTAPDRLWMVHAGVMSLRRIEAFLSRLRRRARPSFCPNYLLTLSSLELDERNLYVAQEVSQAVPLWGEEGYLAFLDANAWARRFLPNLPERGRLGAWSASGTSSGRLGRKRRAQALALRNAR